METLDLYDWARFTGNIAGKAQFRSEIEDFQVTENLRFEPSGQGAHHLLFIEKRNLNTDTVSQKLCRFAGVKPLDIGYAGKKDRFAIAKQWFSVQLPLLKEIDWQKLNDEEITVLQATRHDKKLRIGAVKANHFKIILRDFNGDKDILNSKLQQIEEFGFPNYFGEQRFGHNGDNLNRGLDLLSKNKRLKNRNLQGLYYSAVRSAIFNHLVSKRIQANQFCKLLDGDYVQLDGTESGFLIEDLSKETPRFLDKDIHPTATLVGRGRQRLASEALISEQEQLVSFESIIEALGKRGLNLDSRSIRVFPKNVMLTWHNEATLELDFSLPKGAFATSFLRELVELEQKRIFSR